MARTDLLTVLVVLFMSAGWGQSFRPVRYLGEIGHLDTDWDPRKVADFGGTKLSVAGSDVRLEGKDDRGKQWQAVVAVVGGVSWTGLWRGDFDANSRQDLMIAAVSFGNGHCISEVRITFLMFDSVGGPVPWTIDTFLPKGADIGKMPVLIRDHNRRAQLIATGCDISWPASGEDRYMTGIYEAQDAHWKMILPSNLKSYSDAMHAAYASPFVHFLELPNWKDHGNTTASYNARVKIRQVLSPDPACRGVRLPIVDGRVVQVPNPDPCEVLGQNRIETDNGDVCLGWPTVVQDRESGREILTADSSGIESKLNEMAAVRLPVALIGQSDPKHCSPTLLWINRAR